MPLAFFSTFKLLQYNREMSKLWQTLAIASDVLGAYVFIVLVVFVGFSLMGYFTFGADIAAYSTFTGAFMQVRKRREVLTY